MNILPSVGADSVMYYVSLMIVWGIEYWALWDNDVKGRECREKAEGFFGVDISRKHFFLLPMRNPSKKRILQHLFCHVDIGMIKHEMGLPVNSSFEKVIASLFYSPDRSRIIGAMSDETKENFNLVFAHLSIN